MNTEPPLSAHALALKEYLARCRAAGDTRSDSLILSEVVSSPTARELLQHSAGYADRPAAPGEELTERQLEVLRLIAAGKTQTEIAAELFVSIQTMKNHTRAIRDRLDARTLPGAVAVAFRRGLLQ